MGGGHPWSVVTPNLDTLLTALYVEIDDHVIPSGPRRPGQPKRLSDAELVCLAVAQVLLGATRQKPGKAPLGLVAGRSVRRIAAAQGRACPGPAMGLPCGQA